MQCSYKAIDLITQEKLVIVGGRDYLFVFLICIITLFFFYFSYLLLSIVILNYRLLTELMPFSVSRAIISYINISWRIKESGIQQLSQDHRKFKSL